jgi:predicted glycosyltransferase involved in capsule biosynthesis
MNQLALVVVEKATEKFASGETESMLKEGGQHHNFIGVGSEDIFILSRLPLEDDT